MTNSTHAITNHIFSPFQLWSTIMSFDTVGYLRCTAAPTATMSEISQTGTTRCSRTWWHTSSNSFLVVIITHTYKNYKLPFEMKFCNACAHISTKTSTKPLIITNSRRKPFIASLTTTTYQNYRRNYNFAKLYNLAILKSAHFFPSTQQFHLHLTNAACSDRHFAGNLQIF